MKQSDKPGFGRVVIGLGAIGALIALAAQLEAPSKVPTKSTPAETYHLVHAIGNTEKITARGLSKVECETQKSELKGVAEALGTYNEKTGFGSIVCLPDSLLNN
jgi:threonine dehydrogenase-like Zn-dependent dehydrogenase